jgi:hypothetical protein
MIWKLTTPGAGTFTAPAPTLTINNSPTGGTFQLVVTVGGSTQTSSSISYNPTAAAVQSALQGCSNIGSGNALVSGPTGGPFTITWGAGLVPTVAAVITSLTGGTMPYVAYTPAPVSPITVYVIGGGGGGGSGDDSDGPGGGGGGGGSASKQYTVTVGQTFNYNVGAGGTADVDGGDTWFNNSTDLLGGGGGCGDNASDGDQGGGPGGGTGETSWQTGNPLSTNIGSTTFIGGFGAEGGNSSAPVAGNVGGPGGGSGTAYQNGVTPAAPQYGPTDKKMALVAGIGWGNGGPGAFQFDSTASTAATAPGGGGGGGASSSLSAAAGAPGMIIIVDSGVAPANTYQDQFLPHQAWNDPVCWTMGRPPQDGDALNYIGSHHCSTDGPTSLVVLASMDTYTGVLGSDSQGTTNVMIAPGGYLLYGPIGPWTGNASCAASCTFNSQRIQGATVNNATFNGTSTILNSSTPSGLFGTTTWNSSNSVLAPGIPTLFAPAAHGAKNLLVAAGAIGGFSLGNNVLIPATAASSALEGHSYELNIRFAMLPRRPT